MNAFDESGGGASGLRISSQKRKSEVWSVGARAIVNWGNWMPWVRVTADKERRDDARVVTAMPLSLASVGSTYDVPTWKPDTSWITTAIGVSGKLAPNVGVSVTYTRVDGRSNIKEDGVSGILSYHF